MGHAGCGDRDALAIEDLLAEDHDGGVPVVVELYEKGAQVLNCTAYAPYTVDLPASQLPGHLPGHAVAEVIDVELR